MHRAGHGLQVGELYIARAVVRRKARGRVVTTVMVDANRSTIEVIEAEAFLRRTRVLVEVMAPNGQVTTHSFPDPEELDVWCAFTRTPANRIRNKRHVQAEPTPPGSCRFTAMCVPMRATNYIPVPSLASSAICVPASASQTCVTVPNASAAATKLDDTAIAA